MLTLVVTFLLGAFTVLGGIFYLMPNLDVQPVMELPTGRVFPNAFSLKNDGYLTVYPKEVRFVIRDAIDTNQNAFHNCGAGTEFVSKVSLQRGESADIAVNPAFNIGQGSIVRADILLVVKFQQWGWKWPITKRVKIEIWKDALGNTKFAKPPLTDEDRKQ